MFGLEWSCMIYLMNELFVNEPICELGWYLCEYESWVNKGWVFMYGNECKWCFWSKSKVVYNLESKDFKTVNFDIETYDASN